MPITPRHMPNSIDPEETSSGEKSPTTLTTQNVVQRPIWEVIVEIGEQIPNEERAKVPSDASVNYKHYLYGMLKKNG